MNGTYNQWTSKSDVVRDAGSPQDLVTVFRKIGTYTGTVEVPFAEGSEVLIFPVAKATVVKNPTTGQNEVTFNLEETGGGAQFTDPLAGVMIQGKNQQQQTSFTGM